MIIDCISDLHGHFPKLEGGDLLIIAGDLTATDTVQESISFQIWLHDQNYKKKILIAGNHDNRIAGFPFSAMSRHYQEMGETYLCDSGTEFEGFKIWGSPWTTQFPGINPKCCAFTRPFMSSLQDRWELIPDDVDILITHTPPYSILDKVATEFGASVGDQDLLKELDSRIKPKLHVFGHIHENGGKQMIFKRLGYGIENNTICVNASIVNEYYKPVNDPIRITL